MDVIISLLDILSLVLLLFIVHLYSQQGAITYSFLPSTFLDNNGLMPVAMFLVFFSLKSAAGYLLQKAQYHFVYNVAARLSEKNLLNYLQGNYEDYVSIDSAVHIRKISEHPIQFGHYILAAIQQIITQSILVAASLAAILWFNAKLFALLFLLLMPPVIVIAFIIKKRTRAARTKTQGTSERALQYLKESLSGYIESNIYGKHHYFSKRYAGWQKQLNDQLSGLQTIQGISSRLLEVFAVLGLFVLVALGKWNNNNSFNVLTIGAFMAAAYKIMPGIVKMLNCSGQIRAYAFVVHDLALAQSAFDKTQTQRETAKPLHPIRAIAFKKISFTYRNQLVLDKLDFYMESGDFVGIAGISGSGKTTIGNLLMGFTTQQSGDILINDELTTAQWRKQYRKNIAYVKQQPFLIHDSILRNIVLDEKVYDLPRLNAVIKASGLNELVDADKEGMDKLIAENGKNISGGQRQRIVIARALYKEADLVIMDEPFNELDAESERRLLEYFRSVAASGKIVILITHNRDSLLYCNKTIHLDEA